MGAPRGHRRLDVVGCGPNCTLGKGVLGDARAELVHSWFEAGLNNGQIQAEAEGFDPSWHLGLGSLSRHRANHLVPHKGGADEPALPLAPGQELSDLEALRLFISRGARYIPTWKIGPKDWMDALNMYYRLTQGSAMTDLLSALSAAASGEDEEIEVAPSDPALTPQGEDEPAP